MLVTFKSSVTYKKFLTSRRATLSVVKQLSSDITRFFAGRCPIFGANIQDWRLLEHVFMRGALIST